jgi:hypothetical protein
MWKETSRKGTMQEHRNHINEDGHYIGYAIREAVWS